MGAYNTLLFELEEWRPRVNAMNFKILRVQEVEKLKELFSKEVSVLCRS